MAKDDSKQRTSVLASLADGTSWALPAVFQLDERRTAVAAGSAFAATEPHVATARRAIERNARDQDAALQYAAILGTLLGLQGDRSWPPAVAPRWELAGKQVAAPARSAEYFLALALVCALEPPTSPRAAEALGIARAVAARWRSAWTSTLDLVEWSDLAELDARAVMFKCQAAQARLQQSGPVAAATESSETFVGTALGLAAAYREAARSAAATFAGRHCRAYGAYWEVVAAAQWLVAQTERRDPHLVRSRRLANLIDRLLLLAGGDSDAAPSELRRALDPAVKGTLGAVASALASDTRRRAILRNAPPLAAPGANTDGAQALADIFAPIRPVPLAVADLVLPTELAARGDQWLVSAGGGATGASLRVAPAAPAAAAAHCLSPLLLGGDPGAAAAAAADGRTEALLIRAVLAERLRWLRVLRGSNPQIIVTDSDVKAAERAFAAAGTIMTTNDN